MWLELAIVEALLAPSGNHRSCRHWGAPCAGDYFAPERERERAMTSAMKREGFSIGGLGPCSK